MSAEQEQEQEQRAMDAAVDALLRSPEGMDEVLSPHLSIGARVKLKHSSPPRGTSNSAIPPGPPNRTLSYTSLPHLGFGEEPEENDAAAPGNASSRSGSPSHGFAYQRAPVYTAKWYEEVMFMRAQAREAGEVKRGERKAGEDSGMELDGEGKAAAPVEAEDTTHDDADLVADWNKSLRLLELDQQHPNEAVGPTLAAYPCDVGRLDGIRVDKRVPEKLLVKRLRERRGSPEKQEGALAVKAEDAVQPPSAVHSSPTEVPTRPGIQPNACAWPSWYSNKSPADSDPGLVSGSGDTVPSFSPPTPMFGYPYAEPYLDPTHNPYDFEAGLYGIGIGMDGAAFHNSAYAYDQSPGGQLAALELARTGGLTTLGVAPSAAYGTGLYETSEPGHALGLTSGMDVPWNTQNWAAADVKGKGKAPETIAPTMAAIATHVQVINQAALADMSRLQDGAGAASAAHAPKPSPAQVIQPMPFIEYQPSPPNTAGDQKRRRASVRPGSAAAVAASTVASGPQTAASQSPTETKPSPPTEKAPAPAASRKRKSESLSQTQASTARATVKPAAETEVDIQKRRREGNAAAAKKCRENQKAKYETLSREKSDLLAQLKDATAHNAKLLATVQRLQCENSVLRKEKFDQFNKDAYVKMSDQ